MLFSTRTIGQSLAQKAAVAVTQIQDLKNGTLLIKLNTQSARINYRLKSGQKKRAQRLIDEVEREHNEIIAAFKENYNFSEYYFYLSDDSDYIIRKEDYSYLFKIKNEDNRSVTTVKNPFILSLEVPPEHSSAVDKYKFVLYEIIDNKIVRCRKPMPYVFKTRNFGFFLFKPFSDYKFDLSLAIANKRLIEFYEKSQTEYYQNYLFNR